MCKRDDWSIIPATEVVDSQRGGKGNPRRSHTSITRRVLTTSVLLAASLGQNQANAADLPGNFNLRAQIACEAEMLGGMDAQEVFSGRAYDALSEVARAYHRPIPHLYVFEGGWNMAYLAASAAVDGRGKIVMGKQAIDIFDPLAIRGFLGHEMAHLVSDRAAQTCNDYLVRDPQMEADADALAARTIGFDAVKAFLNGVLDVTAGQNYEAKHRLVLLQGTVELSLSTLR